MSNVHNSRNPTTAPSDNEPGRLAVAVTIRLTAAQHQLLHWYVDRLQRRELRRITRADAIRRVLVAALSAKRADKEVP